MGWRKGREKWKEEVKVSHPPPPSSVEGGGRGERGLTPRLTPAAGRRAFPAGRHDTSWKQPLLSVQCRPAAPELPQTWGPWDTLFSLPLARKSSGVHRVHKPLTRCQSQGRRSAAASFSRHPRLRALRVGACTKRGRTTINCKSDEVVSRREFGQVLKVETQVTVYMDQIFQETWATWPAGMYQQYTVPSI